MDSARNPRTLVLAAAAVILASAAVLNAGDSVFQSTLGDSFFSSNKPCKAGDIPPLEVLAPVPAIVDPFEDDIIPVFCQLSVEKNGRGVNRAKADFTSELIVRDNNTGMFEVFPLDSGKLTTNSDGIDSFDFEIPAPLFADGFESGDVSAWSYTRVERTKKKSKQDKVACHTGSSSSGNYRGGRAPAPAIDRSRLKQ